MHFLLPLQVRLAFLEWQYVGVITLIAAEEEDEKDGMRLEKVYTTSVTGDVV